MTAAAKPHQPEPDATGTPAPLPTRTGVYPPDFGDVTAFPPGLPDAIRFDLLRDPGCARLGCAVADGEQDNPSPHAGGAECPPDGPCALRLMIRRAAWAADLNSERSRDGRRMAVVVGCSALALAAALWLGVFSR